MGITPAHAGKSLTHFCVLVYQEDHPRTRGEKCIRDFLKRGNEGSPPHTRGKEAFRQTTTLYLRITPAHAGKSLNIREQTNKNKDHPRTRGEKATDRADDDH